MGRSIVKQPNGLYAVFSTLVDDYIIVNSTIEELIEDFVQEYREKIEKELTNTAKILDGAHIKDCYPYYSRHITWEETEKTRKSVHERNEVDN